jgi:SAM-dependent methyltransferase
LTPRRHRGAEHLDDPHLDGALTVRSLRDVARSNTLFGGRRAVLRALDGVLDDVLGAGLAGAGGTEEGRAAGAASLLDVGTGLGDIPFHARRLAAARGVRLTTIGVELNAALAAASRVRIGHALVGDGFRLPFPDASVDLVTASQVLHHFAEPEAALLLRELDRVARVRVVVADLRRSWLAAGGFWLASWPLGFHPVSRHDGVLSVLRGFTAPELRALVRDATGADADVRHRLGWRVVASWRPAHAPRAVVDAAEGVAERVASPDVRADADAA